MKMKTRLALLFAVALSVAILLSGCVKEQPSGEPKTCSELSGSNCSAGQECTGKWLEASDSFSCCSIPCMTAASGEALEIEPFEQPPENQEFGDVA